MNCANCDQIEGLVVSDPDQHNADTGGLPPLDRALETAHEMLFDRRFCEDCRKTIKSQRRPFRFSGYSNINTSDVSSLTNHQYFVCSWSAVAYVLKERTWSTCICIEPLACCTNR